MGTMRRIRLALLTFAMVLVGGTVGYVILGFGFLDALYQTVTTVPRPPGYPTPDAPSRTDR